MADSSARPKLPKACRLPTPYRAQSRFSAPRLSNDPRDSGVSAARKSETIPAQSASRASLTSTSRGASRASSGASRTNGQSITRNSPVEISAQAKAASPRTSAQAAR